MDSIPGEPSASIKTLTSSNLLEAQQPENLSPTTTSIIYNINNNFCLPLSSSYTTSGQQQKQKQKQQQPSSIAMLAAAAPRSPLSFSGHRQHQRRPNSLSLSHSNFAKPDMAIAAAAASSSKDSYLDVVPYGYVPGKSDRIKRWIISIPAPPKPIHASRHRRGNGRKKNENSSRPLGRRLLSLSSSPSPFSSPAGLTPLDFWEDRPDSPDGNDGVKQALARLKSPPLLARKQRKLPASKSKPKPTKNTNDMDKQIESFFAAIFAIICVFIFMYGLNSLTTALTMRREYSDCHCY